MMRGNGTGQSRSSRHSWGERWTKVYENALTDIKYLAIADKTGAPRLLIGATFTELLLYTGTHHPDTGSFEGFDVRVWARWAEASVELIERVLEGLREFGLLVGNAIANWAKRQGKNSIAGAEKVVSDGALRQRRYRARKAEETCRAQSEECAQPPGPNPETHHPGCASRELQEASPSVTLGVTAGITVTVEEEGEALETEVVLKNDEVLPGRCAPLCEPQPSEKVVQLSDNAALKVKEAEVKKRKRRQKCTRYIKVTYAGEECLRRLAGMAGCDMAHDAQWWFDCIDREREAAKWDDIRDRGAARKLGAAA
jgi:hypothetical protein